MAVTVKVGPYMATIDGWEWTGDNEALIALLNANLDPDGPSGADPDPDGNEAKRIAELFKGEVVSQDEAEYVEDRVY